MKKVEITIELDPATQEIVLQSLLPEVGRTVPRTQVNISETHAGILISIEAKDTNALRGALNSYLRWLDCIISITSKFKSNMGA